MTAVWNNFEGCQFHQRLSQLGGNLNRKNLPNNKYNLFRLHSHVGVFVCHLPSKHRRLEIICFCKSQFKSLDDLGKELCHSIAF